MIYAVVLGFVTVIGVLFVVGVLLILLLVAVGILWIALACVAAVKAGQGGGLSLPVDDRLRAVAVTCPRRGWSGPTV